jgi:hypothetical protein
VDIRIDTLRLQASGMDADTASRFARLVAERLGAALATWPAAPGEAAPAEAGPGDARPGDAWLGALRVAVPARAWDSPDSLAAHLATEVSRSLRWASTSRSGGSGAAPAGRR